MKKVISLFLSVVMLFSITAGMDFSAYAFEYGTIKSISYKPIQPIEFLEGTEGDIDFDSSGNEYYYYYGDYEKDGDILTLNYENGMSVDYTLHLNYHEDYYYWQNSDGEFLPDDNDYDNEFWRTGAVYYDSNQTLIHWKPCSDNYITVSYMDIETKIPVTIIENPVAGISYEPVNPVELRENVDGSMNTDDNSNEYFHYTYSYNIGDKLTVNYKDGKSEEYTCNFINLEFVFLNENGDRLDGYVDFEDNQGDEHWSLGGDYCFTAIYMGAETQLPVKITENNIKNISFNSVKEKVVSEKFYDDYDCREYYYAPELETGDTLTVNYKNGISVDYKCLGHIPNCGGMGYFWYFQSSDGAVIEVASSLACEYVDSTPDSKVYFKIWAEGLEIIVPVSVAGEHIHAYSTETIKPTCTEKGYTKHICSCGDTYNDSYINASGHKQVTKIEKAKASQNGKIVKSCTVCKKTLSSTIIPKIASIKLSATSYTYDGKVKTPTVTVKDSKGKMLKKNTDYTVTYANGRKNVGKYAVKITFKGNYSGTKTLYFTIKPKATSISKLTAKSKGFTVKWKKLTTQTTGYQIQYSTSSKFKSAKTVTVSKSKTTSKTISKLKGKKKYYVRIRTYKTVGKTKYYSAWSKAKSVIAKK